MTEVAKRSEFVDRFVDLATALPDYLNLPADLTKQDFRKLLNAMHTVHRKSAFYWGLLYKEAVERFGHDAYDMFDWVDYQESTLQNAARLTDQIHPSLWNERIPLRHMQAIGQNIPPDRLDEQRAWIVYSKNNSISGDDLRKEIHSDLEKRGLRSPEPRRNWHTCETCNGDGGWPEPTTDDE